MDNAEVEYPDYMGPRHILSAAQQRDPTALVLTGGAPLIYENNYGLLVGPSESGKSMLANAIGLALSAPPHRRISPAGLEIPEQRNVLYIDRENRERRAARRLAKLGLTLDHTFTLVCRDPISLNDRAGVDHLLLEIAKHRAQVVIFDTLTRFHNQNENASDQMAVVTRNILDVCDEGVTVLMLHHTSKGGRDRAKEPVHTDDTRGSGEIGAGADTELMLRTEGDRFIATVTKDREIKKSNKPTFTYTIEGDDELRLVNIKDAEDARIMERILDLAKSPSQKGDVRSAVDARPEVFDRCLSRLEAQNKISVTRQRTSIILESIASKNGAEPT